MFMANLCKFVTLLKHRIRMYKENFTVCTYLFVTTRRILQHIKTFLVVIIFISKASHALVRTGHLFNVGRA